MRWVTILVFPHRLRRSRHSKADLPLHIVLRLSPVPEPTLDAVLESCEWNSSLDGEKNSPLQLAIARGVRDAEVIRRLVQRHPEAIGQQDVDVGSTL